LEPLTLLVLGILPGALYTWSFEQQTGRWGSTAADRAQRFLGASAVFLVAELPVLYGVVYRHFVVTGDIREGRALPAWICSYLWHSSSCLSLSVESSAVPHTGVVSG